MQTENLFEFLYIILDKRKVTATQMASHFGVSPRTIYRWVDALCVSGVPLFMIKGKGGGISVSDSYSIDATVLSEEERVSLISSISAFKNLSGASKDSEYSSLMSKLGHLARKNTDWVKIDFAPWNPEGIVVRSLFEKIKKAILDGTQIIFDYASPKSIFQKRSFQPWTLVFRGQSWYVYGFCNTRKAPRYFKLCRIQNLFLTTKKQTQDKDAFKQDDEFKTYSEKFEKIKISLQVQEKALYRILDELNSNSFLDNKNGTYTVCAEVPDLPYLVSWILSFGSGVKVLEPENLRQKIITEAQKIYSANVY